MTTPSQSVQPAVPSRIVAPSPALLEKLIGLWWIRIPAIARYLSSLLAVALSDGLYLSLVPPVAAFAPPVLLFVGFLLGWLHFPPEITYTFSLPVMVIMLVISSFGAGFGAWLWLGYLIGDLLLAHHDQFNQYETFGDKLINVGIPLLISYILLAMLLIALPTIAQGLRRVTIPRLKLPRLVFLLIEVVLQAVLMGALVYIWVESAPTLIRPVFTWNLESWNNAGSPPIEAIRPLQENGNILVRVAVVLGVLRIGLAYLAMTQQAVQRRFASLSAALTVAGTNRKFSIPFWIGIPFKAIFVTLLMLGMLETRNDAIILALVLLLVMLARQLIVPRLGAWAVLVTRVPLLVRLAVGILLDFYIAQFIISNMWDKTNTFQPVVYSIAVSFVVFVILLPDRAIPASRKPAITGKTSPPPKPAPTGR